MVNVASVVNFAGVVNFASVVNFAGARLVTSRAHGPGAVFGS
ncbi:MAG: hypothetical protein ACRDP7_36565 [Trebonia sp.]